MMNTPEENAAIATCNSWLNVVGLPTYTQMQERIAELEAQLAAPSEQGDSPCTEDDGCPTERAVLQRFWREQLAAPAPSDEAEHFIAEAIDRAPEPLRRLGEYLSKVLDEDRWKTAERMLLGACEAAPAPSNLTDKLIDAAEHYAAVYDDDDRECVKADVMNGFYQGAHWAMKNAAPAPSEPAHVAAFKDLIEHGVGALMVNPDGSVKHVPHSDIYKAPSERQPEPGSKQELIADLQEAVRLAREIDRQANVIIEIAEKNRTNRA